MLDRLLTSFRTVLERYLVVWLVLLCVVAHRWPAWFGSVGLGDPFQATRPFLGYLIAVTMLAIGSLLPRDEVLQVVRHWPSVLGGTAVQYISMPLLAYGLGHLFGFSGPWMIGIMMVGCVPGAMASNVLTLVARGNVSYSVSLTTSATLLSPLVVPWTLWLTVGRTVHDFHALKVCWELLWMVVLPVTAGYTISCISTRWRAVATRIGPILANLVILWIIAVVVAGSRQLLTQIPAQLLGALVAVNISGYTAGYCGAWLLRCPEPMRRALTLEVGMQNSGLGTALAISLFPNEPETALPSAMYAFGCMFTGTILARFWAGRIAPQQQRQADSAPTSAPVDG